MYFLVGSGTFWGQWEAFISAVCCGVWHMSVVWEMPMLPSDTIATSNLCQMAALAPNHVNSSHLRVIVFHFRSCSFVPWGTPGIWNVWCAKEGKFRWTHAELSQLYLAMRPSFPPPPFPDFIASLLPSLLLEGSFTLERERGKSVQNLSGWNMF